MTAFDLAALDALAERATPGPWLAASRPSSVVGLPIVATGSGRSIASVTFHHLGKAFASHDAESDANARLIALAPAMAAELRRLRDLDQAWLNAEAKIAGLEADLAEAVERVQAIIDWADFALVNRVEFDSHGVRNLDGPIFDEARALLSRLSAKTPEAGG